MRRLLLLASLLLLLLAPGVARADDGGAPWDGGAAVETATEARLGQAAGEIAGRPVQVRCEAPADWTTIVRQTGESNLAGFVWFTAGAPADSMELGPDTCGLLDAFVKAPPAEQCVVGTTVQAAASPAVRTLAARRQPGRVKPLAASVKAPVYGACPQDATRVYAVWTLAHEAVHLSGQRDEAVADCSSLQLLERTASRLGAGPAAAKALAVYAADWYAKVWPASKPGYYSPECRDGGALDLNLQSPAWPS